MSGLGNIHIIENKDVLYECQLKPEDLNSYSAVFSGNQQPWQAYLFEDKDEIITFNPNKLNENSKVDNSIDNQKIQEYQQGINYAKNGLDIITSNFESLDFQNIQANMMLNPSKKGKEVIAHIALRNKTDTIQLISKIDLFNNSKCSCTFYLKGNNDVISQNQQMLKMFHVVKQDHKFPKLSKRITDKLLSAKLQEILNKNTTKDTMQNLHATVGIVWPNKNHFDLRYEQIMSRLENKRSFSQIVKMFVHKVRKVLDKENPLEELMYKIASTAENQRTMKTENKNTKRNYNYRA